MIYSCLNGRLGNNLFEIAAGVSLAKRMNVPFKALMCKDIYMDFSDAVYLKQFGIDLQDTYPVNHPVYQETGFDYHPLPSEKDLVLHGYFQSEKYFDEQLIRDLFRIDSHTENYIREKYENILSRNPVSVLVRRGDYLIQEFRHPVCRMSYYKKAMSVFPPDTDFLIISDDIAWCKKHFIGSRFFFIDDEPPLVDLYIQSLCRHNIISNSTFGWWGAWLNENREKIVVYPSPWFGVTLRKTNVKDLCPENWVKVPLCGSFELFFRDNYPLFAWKSTVFYRKVVNKLLWFAGRPYKY